MNVKIRKGPMHSITKTSTLKGQAVNILGDSNPWELRLQTASGIAVKCTINESMARKLTCLHGCSVEVAGEGTWCRDEKGRWKLAELVVNRFSELEDVSVTETIERLR